MSLLENLAHRVSRLERELALAKAGDNGGAQADQIVDSYARVSPTGEITFDFDGHIFARGITLEGESGAGSLIQQIRWESDTPNPNDLVSEISAGLIGGIISVLQLYARTPTDPNRRTGFLLQNGRASGKSMITVEADDDAQQADGLLLDSDYFSDWVGLTKAERMVRPRWRVSRKTVSYNPPSIAANTTINPGVALPAGTAAVDDICILMGIPNGAANGLIYMSRSGIVQVADTAPIRIRNVTGAAIDDPALDLNFLVINHWLFP